MEEIRQYKKKVKCDGLIVILRSNPKLILKYKPEKKQTVDLKYIGKNIFIDNDMVMYYYIKSNNGTTTEGGHTSIIRQN